MQILKYKISVYLLLAVFVLQAGAVFLQPLDVFGQDDVSTTTIENQPSTADLLRAPAESFSTVVSTSSPELMVYFIEPQANIHLRDSVVLRAKVNLPAEAVYFRLNSANGASGKTFLAEEGEGLIFYYFLNTRLYPNGQYFLEARAQLGAQVNSASLLVYIENVPVNEYIPAAPASSSAISVEPLDIDGISAMTSDAAGEDSAASSEEPLIIDSEALAASRASASPVLASSTSEIQFERRVEFLSAPEFISGSVTIRARSNFLPQSAGFVVSGRSVKEYPAKISGDNIFSFYWTIDPTILQEDYQLSAWASDGGQRVSDTIKVAYEREDYTAKVKAEEEQPFELVFMNTPKEVFGTAKIIVSTSQAVEKIEFEVVGQTRQKFSGQTNLEKIYFFEWPTKNFPDGLYEVKAGAIQGGRILKTIATATLVKNALDDEGPNGLLSEPSAQVSPGISSSTSARETDAGRPDSGITNECRIKSIDTLPACAAYLELPVICRLEGFLTAEPCRNWLALDPVCREKKFNQAQCDLYLRLPRACREANIQGETDCRNFLAKEYEKRLVCDPGDEGECRQKLAAVYLDRAIEAQERYFQLGELSATSSAQSVKSLRSALIGAELIPIRTETALVRLLPAQGVIVIKADGDLRQTAPAVIVLDSDGDGLFDSLEQRIGTDPNKADTDNDGYGDKAEVDNSYNPNGEGRIADKFLSPFEQALVNGEAIEQPLSAGAVDGNLEVAAVDNRGGDSEEGYIIRGRAWPNEALALFVYSELPLVVTVKADETGNWRYEFENSLVDGQHEVYVTVSNQTGRLTKKSRPFAFLVNEAKAVSVHDYVAASVVQNPTEPEGMMDYYVIFSLALIGFSLFLFLFYFGYYRKRTNG